ncbi:MAG: hypothetical protein KIG65_03790 [Eubacteriales bacterium]|nr:hypothetical protein [Eubacteriales bacterium]
MGYDNLAYVWEDDRYEEELKSKREKILLDRKRNVAKKRVIFLGYVVMVILAAVFMIGKNVSEYESELKIKSLEKELAAVESYTSQKLYELEENIDLNAVEEAATTRLGMQRLSKNQTVYVNVKQDDVCELTANEVEGIKNRVAEAAVDLKQNVIGLFSIN